MVCCVLIVSRVVSAALTSDYDQGCEAGEGGDIQLHAMEALRKLHDGVDPVSKASDTLCLVKHDPIAENQLVRLWIRPSTTMEKKNSNISCWAY